MPSACSIVLIGLEPIWRRHTDTCSRSRTKTSHLNKGLDAWKARLEMAKLLLVLEGTHKISIGATFRCSRGFTSRDALTLLWLTVAKNHRGKE